MSDDENFGFGPEVKVFHLTGSDEVTTQIATSHKMAEDLIPKAVEVAEGNPGAMTHLVQIYKTLNNDADFALLCSCLKIKKLKGSDLYSFVKKHGIESAISQFRKAGWV